MHKKKFCLPRRPLTHIRIWTLLVLHFRARSHSCAGLQYSLYSELTKLKLEGVRRHYFTSMMRHHTVIVISNQTTKLTYC